MLNWNCLLAFKFFTPSVYKNVENVIWNNTKGGVTHVRECCIDDHEKRKSKALC